MEELLLTVVPATVHEQVSPMPFQYHTADEVELPAIFDSLLFDDATWNAQACEVLMPTGNDDQIRLLVFKDDSEDDDLDDIVDIDDGFDHLDDVPAPQRHTWTMCLHGDAIMPVVSLDGFRFPRGDIRCVMLEFRVDTRRTVQVHLTGTVVKGVESNGTLAAIVNSALPRSAAPLKNIAFRGDVLFSGLTDDESLLVFNRVHTAALSAPAKPHGKRGGKR